MTEPIVTMQRIARLPATHRTLAGHIGTGGGTNASERVSGGDVEAPLPINDRVVELRADIESYLTRWVAVVVKLLAGRFVMPRTTAPAFCAAFILAAWPMLDMHDELPALAIDVDDLTARADAITDPPDRHVVADRIGEGLIAGRDVATVLGVAASTIRAWVADGALIVRERGPNGRNLYALDDIRALKVKRDNALTAWASNERVA